jgi:hypothetical protein
MPIYTVHEPPAKRSETRRGPENFRFVRDGFHFWAFLLTPLWLLWRRLWLVFIGYVVLVVALSLGLRWLGASENAVFAVLVLLSILIGLEAGSLQRWTLRRRKWGEAGVVSAYNAEAAEQRFFDAWTGGELTAAAPAPSVTAAFGAAPMRRPVAGQSDIVGLFPEPGAQR